MPRPTKGPRIYTRRQGGELRYYGDFRSFGGKQEALKAEDETLATTDPVIAQKLFTDRLEQFQEGKRNKHLLGVRRSATLQKYASAHLVKKAKAGKVTETWLATLEHNLEAAIEFFGAGRDLGSIGVEDVQRFAEWLGEQPNGRGGKLAPGSQRQYLSALSNLFRRAQGEGILRGVNPVGALMDKPAAAAREAEWLEVWEGALLLESARTYPAYVEQRANLAARLSSALAGWGGDGAFALRRFQQALRQRGRVAADEQLERYLRGEAIPERPFVNDAAEILGVEPEWLRNGGGELLRPLPAYAHALLATYLLTGGRETEVAGLELVDVSFRRKTITFRPNEWRRLKTRSSHRTVPLWPQLEQILEEYLGSGDRPDGPGLLFPSGKASTKREEMKENGDGDAERRASGMIADFRKSLDAIARRVGWQDGEVRTKAFRHTYCAARLQTLDRGHPVAEYTVGREMGHGGFSLVRKVYGHLGTIRHRSEVVEYRLEQHAEEIPPERIQLLAAV
jgi:integrase